MKVRHNMKKKQMKNNFYLLVVIVPIDQDERSGGIEMKIHTQEVKN